MMGQQTGGEAQLFYAFNLDEYVPEHHLLRRIDRFLDLSKLRSHLADYYSHTGRPSVDPELMIRMLIVGYCFGIRSERQLARGVDGGAFYACDQPSFRETGTSRGTPVAASSSNVRERAGPGAGGESGHPWLDPVLRRLQPVCARSLTAAH